MSTTEITFLPTDGWQIVRDESSDAGHAIVLECIDGKGVYRIEGNVPTETTGHIYESPEGCVNGHTRTVLSYPSSGTENIYFLAQTATTLAKTKVI